jgi:Pyruvate/2-oxoacid:ferredoxin oxidoreductase delta subunit
VTDPDALYRRLQRHLDRMPVGFPATESGVEIRILKRLFTPGQAEIALQLSAIPEPLATVHRRVGSRMTADALREALDRMAKAGLIEKITTPGDVRYGKTVFAVGIYERQLPRLTAEFQRDARQYFEEAFGPAFHKKETTQLRTVPVNVTIVPDHSVATYDDIRAFVRSSDGPFATMNCICRYGKELEGGSCAQTKLRENCLTFGVAAESMVDAGAARYITREAMLDLLDAADEEGLVLEPQNTKEPLFVCCCCGCCCAVLTMAKRFPRPAEYFTTSYLAVVAPDLCEACGHCETRCQMDAVALNGDAAEVKESHCIGCGLCVTTCPSEAITLRKTEAPKTVPDTTPALYARMFRERYGPWGMARAMGRKLLGLKV